MTEGDLGWDEHSLFKCFYMFLFHQNLYYVNKVGVSEEKSQYSENNITIFNIMRVLS